MTKRTPLHRFAARVLACMIVITSFQAAAPMTAKAEDIRSDFNITTEKTPEQIIKDSALGNGNVAVDGPGTSSSYTGNSWQENGNITVEEDESGLLDNSAVFKFYLHDEKDYDGGNTDRQRIELKGYNKSKEDVLAKEDDIITYNWKFKLADDLVDTPPAGFFHIFQIKAIDGSEAGAPIFTFTVTADELLFRNVRIGADMSTIEVIDRMPISEALGKWLEADVTIHYRDNGYVQMTLTDCETGSTVMSGSGSYDCWRRPEHKLSDGSWAEGSEDAPVTQRARPKWGLYRSIGKLGSGTPVSDATMWFGDLTIIKRDRETYVFDDGYDPDSAGEVPDRTLGTTVWTDTLTKDNVKAGYAYGDSVMNLFTEGSSNWAPNKSFANVADNQQLWVAVDLGEVRKLNKVYLLFGGGNDPKRLKNVSMAYTSNSAAFEELVTGNSGTPYPYQTENGSSWTEFLNTNGSPSKEKTWYLDETIEARYVIMVADGYNSTDIASHGGSGSIKFVNWLLSYTEEAPDPLKIAITSPVSGDKIKLDASSFTLEGEISSILDFDKLSDVQVLNENKEVIASCKPAADKDNSTRATFSVKVPLTEGDHKYTVQVTEPSNIAGSTRIDKAYVIITGETVEIENSDNEEDEDDYASKQAEVRGPILLKSSDESRKLSISSGNKVTMSVKSASSGVTYQWYVDRGDGKGFVAIPGADGAVYTPVVTSADNGNVYHCVVTNENGDSISSPFTLKVTGSDPAGSASDAEFNPNTGAF